MKLRNKSANKKTSMLISINLQLAHVTSQQISQLWPFKRPNIRNRSDLWQRPAINVFILPDTSTVPLISLCYNKEMNTFAIGFYFLAMIYTLWKKKFNRTIGMGPQCSRNAYNFSPAKIVMQKKLSLLWFWPYYFWWLVTW